MFNYGTDKLGITGGRLCLFDNLARLNRSGSGLCPKPRFIDDFTCKFVRIAGGPLEDSHTPVFKVRKNKLRSTIPAGICASSNVFVGECDGKPFFDNGASESVPGANLFGKAPPKRFLMDLVEEFERHI